MAAPLIPSEYGYVVLTTASTFFVGLWHGIRVGQFRKAAGIGYPTPYATEQDIVAAKDSNDKKAMYLFNCSQRAHGNWNENHPSFCIAMLISGLQYPLATTAMGLGWTFFRILFALGYTDPNKEDGKGRLRGAPFWLFQFGLWGTTVWSGVKMVGWA